jgi:dCTP deaminase
MIIPAQTLRIIKPVEPFHERTHHNGFTFGCGPAGYDVRIREDVCIPPGEFRLASTLERFNMPNDIMGIVHDKSTWARLGLAVQNTVIEPGWKGYLTVELTNHHPARERNLTYEDHCPMSEGYDYKLVRGYILNRQHTIEIKAGTPIAQIVFHRLEVATDTPYEGKYQGQKEGVQPAIIEGTNG